ncbi:hypothetical protein C8R45DRAFT_306297 [Mycena sanguinolenta]|nr:hypothetical protein C8R45DRAFT_306297 [Mycena sanguinolenta]
MSQFALCDAWCRACLPVLCTLLECCDSWLLSSGSTMSNVSSVVPSWSVGFAALDMATLPYTILHCGKFIRGHPCTTLLLRRLYLCGAAGLRLSAAPIWLAARPVIVFEPETVIGVKLPGLKSAINSLSVLVIHPYHICTSASSHAT